MYFHTYTKLILTTGAVLQHRVQGQSLGQLSQSGVSNATQVRGAERCVRPCQHQFVGAHSHQISVDHFTW